MSVQRRGKTYVVRWHDGGRQFARSFLKKRDADVFDIEVKRRKQLGTLAAGIMQSKLTVAEFVREDWWPRYVIVNLKSSTQERYLEIWGTHLLPRLGDFELRVHHADADRGRSCSDGEPACRHRDSAQSSDGSSGDSATSRCARVHPR